MNDNIEKPENVPAEETANDKPGRFSCRSVLAGYIIGLGFMAYAVISGQSDILEIALNADDTAPIKQFIETFLIMARATGAGLCGFGSCLFVNSYTGGTREDKEIGTIAFLSGIIMIALRELVSVGAMPIQ